MGTDFRLCPYCNQYYDKNGPKHMCWQKKQHYLKRHKRYAKKIKYVDQPLHTKRWHYLRKRMLANHPYCIRCLKKYGIYNYQNLQIHHIKPRIKYTSRKNAYDTHNLVVVCGTCNEQLGTKQWKHKNGTYALDFYLDLNKYHKNKHPKVHFVYAL